MVFRKNKFKISIEKLQIEFEGGQEEGQLIQHEVRQALGGLMNTQARLLNIRDQAGRIVNGEVVEAEASPGSSAMDGSGEKQKQPRQRRPKGGPSLVNLLRTLKHEGFFSQPRPVSEIMIRLRDKGHNCRPETVSTRLLELTQKEELHRATSGEEGVYVYKDTPFHESIRSPSPPDQPAE